MPIDAAALDRAVKSIVPRGWMEAYASGALVPPSIMRAIRHEYRREIGHG